MAQATLKDFSGAIAEALPNIPGHLIAIADTNSFLEKIRLPLSVEVHEFIADEYWVFIVTKAGRVVVNKGNKLYTIAWLHTFYAINSANLLAEIGPEQDSPNLF